MMDFNLLLCTDLDRTLLPNGSQPESPQTSLIWSVDEPAGMGLLDD